MTWLPEHDDVMEIHFGLAELFKDEDDPISPPGARDENLVHSACARPRTGIGEHDKYESDYQKLAALFHSLTQNHAFHNGNKRTALVTLLATLYRNSRILKFEVSDDEIYELTVAVARGSFIHQSDRVSPDDAVEMISDWLQRNTMARNASLSDMQVNDFIQRCVSRGCQHKEQNGAHHISIGMNSIKIGVDTRKFAGAVARTYLKRLGLTFEQTGMTFAEFQNSEDAERSEINKYMSVLRRLAKI